jgi:hypothetical protein
MDGSGLREVVSRLGDAATALEDSAARHGPAVDALAGTGAAWRGSAADAFSSSQATRAEQYTSVSTNLRAMVEALTPLADDLDSANASHTELEQEAATHGLVVNEDDTLTPSGSSVTNLETSSGLAAELSRALTEAHSKAENAYAIANARLAAISAEVRAESIDASRMADYSIIAPSDVEPYALRGDPKPPTVYTKEGAFQQNEANDYDSWPWYDKLLTEDDKTDLETAGLAEAFMSAEHLTDAREFFEHYEDGSGSDLRFDAAEPYQASPHFKSLVNGTVRDEIRLADASGKTSFDSGYVYHTDPFPDSKDWHNAIGGCYYRVAGHRGPQGTWVTQLRITSYYQFRDGHNFGNIGPLHGLVQGSAMRNLERVGIAQNYHEIGRATLVYHPDGSLKDIVQPPTVPGPVPSPQPGPSPIPPPDGP